jgi:uncharacterized membrane protein (UPF0127 family)
MRSTSAIDTRGRRWRVEVTTTRRERMRGLRGRGPLPEGSALLLRRCRSVHTFGMSEPITVAFLDGSWRVVHVLLVPPRRFTRPRLRARHVLEFGADTDIARGERFGPG